MSGDYDNHLLRLLSPGKLRVLSTHFQPIHFEPGQLLEVAGAAIEDVHFLESGLLSIVGQSAGRQPIEIGMIGREGLTGHGLLLGSSHSSRDVRALLPGKAFRVDAMALTSLLRQHPTLQASLLRAVMALIDQLSGTVVGLGRAQLDARLARWLLMAADRIGDDISLTHDEIALAVGVRRPGITDALHRLEGLHLIRSTRKLVSIRDRPALEASASDLYQKTLADVSGATRGAV